MRTATHDEINSMQRQAHECGWQDGLMRRECTAPYPQQSMQARKYMAGYKAGAGHRAFLNARGMRYVTRTVEKRAGGWYWSVSVEGSIEAQGQERTRKIAEQDAESKAVELAFQSTN